jgi:hypothetical protein
MRVGNKKVLAVFALTLITLVAADLLISSWLFGWTYRKSHLIISSAGADSNYVVNITVVNSKGIDSGAVVYTDNKARPDFEDIRFTDSYGSLLDYWTESVNSGSNATFWVKIAGNLSSADQTIYVYYGNENAPTLSNGTKTFLLFDHFDDNILDTSLWRTTKGRPIESGTVLTLKACEIRSNFIAPKNFRFRTNASSTNLYDSQIGLMANDETDYALFTICNPGPGVQFATLTANNSNSNYHYTAPLTSGAYYTLEADYKGSDFVSYYRNNSLFYNQTTITPGDTMNVRFLSTSLNPTLNIDWFFISRFTYPEPSHGFWGHEERFIV